MIFEGFEEEELVETNASAPDPSVKSEVVHRSGGTTITEREHHSTFSMIPGEMSAFGIPERNL